MASLIRLKEEVERHAGGRRIKMTFVGATEAHLLAEEIAAAGVGVILTTPRPVPNTWDQRRV